MIEAFLTFLTENAVASGSAGGIAGAAVVVLAIITKPFGWIFGKPQTVKLDDETKSALTTVPTMDGLALTVPEFIRLHSELKADI